MFCVPATSAERERERESEREREGDREKEKQDEQIQKRVKEGERFGDKVCVSLNELVCVCVCVCVCTCLVQGGQLRGSLSMKSRVFPTPPPLNNEREEDRERKCVRGRREGRGKEGVCMCVSGCL